MYTCISLNFIWKICSYITLYSYCRFYPDHVCLSFWVFPNLWLPFNFAFIRDMYVFILWNKELVDLAWWLHKYYKQKKRQQKRQKESLVFVLQSVPTDKGCTLLPVQSTPVGTSMLWPTCWAKNVTCSCAMCLLASILWEIKTCAHHQKYLQAECVTTALWMIKKIPKFSSPTVMCKPTLNTELFLRMVRLCCENGFKWRKLKQKQDKKRQLYTSRHKINAWSTPAY